MTFEFHPDGEKHIFNWLSGERDPAQRDALLDFLPLLAADPDDPSFSTQPVPALAYPVFLTKVPGTSIAVVYLRNDLFRTLKVREIYRLP